MTPPRRRAFAATAAAMAGLGFGIPCVIGTYHLARTGDVWQFLGFPTYGGGPFERLGVQTSVPLMLAFLLVCAGEAVLAGAIVRRSSWAPAMSTILLPVELAFWIGFALPFGYVFGFARVVLLRFQPTSTRRRSTQSLAAERTTAGSTGSRTWITRRA
ncbi:MAG: hypothetical protein R2726_01395 [Acidimicrobiales bacterium]